MTEKEIQERLKNLNILIVSHTRATGLSQVLRDWLIPKTQEFIFVGHPLYPTKNSNSSMDVYEKGRLRKVYKSFFVFRSGILLYFKDAFVTVYYIFRVRDKVDIAIGVDNLNASILILLKKLKLIKKVIYHTVDYTPKRFSNKLLNNAYHGIDKFCCYHADMIWNSSGKMNRARIKSGMDKSRIAKTVITPDGSNFNYKKRLPISKINRKTVVYLGLLKEGWGLELLIKSFSDVLKKLPDANLLIIGGGPLLDSLKLITKKYKIENEITFTGFIEEHKEIDNLLRRAAIGVAPFKPMRASYKYYSDVGKPKVYLSAGLPVVITKVPEIARVIEKEKAGIVIKYDKNELAGAIITLLQDDLMYRRYRKNAIKLSKTYIWDNIFHKAFSETLSYFGY